MRKHRYYVYIVASRSHTLYIGVTSHLARRISEHKLGDSPGFTATYRCERLVWFETYENVTSAIEREKQLKGWSRVKKIALIERDNPSWTDFSEGWQNAGPSTPLRSGRDDTSQ